LSTGFSHIRHIWISEPLEGSHDERTINLAYDKIEKVLLSFSIDLTSAKEGALDPSRPIKINGKTVPITDLPKDAYSLKVVEKSDIDVTDLVKYSANGTNNVFEVFYRGGKQGFGKGGAVGTLKLSLKIEVPSDETKKAAPVMISPKTKFCMFCQRNIPDDSVCCPYCCQRQPSGGVAGQTKKCVNCSVMLPASARFCKSCGREQPATAKSTDDKTPTPTTPKPTDVKTPTASTTKPTDVKTPTPTTPKPTDDKTPGAPTPKPTDDKTPGATKPSA
jgi:RNA polymerase subunit RPABC4/transcription elongation factor Spt4